MTNHLIGLPSRTKVVDKFVSMRVQPRERSTFECDTYRHNFDTGDQMARFRPDTQQPISSHPTSRRASAGMPIFARESVTPMPSSNLIKWNERLFTTVQTATHGERQRGNVEVKPYSSHRFNF
jgi:hypothetical protein